MWTITDKQLEDIDKKIKAEKQKSVSKGDPSQKKNDINSKSTLSDKNENHLDSYSPSECQSINSSQSGTNAIDINSVIQPCRLYEVISVSDMNADRNYKPFEVILINRTSENDAEIVNEIDVTDKACTVDVCKEVEFHARYEKDVNIEDKDIDWKIEVNNSEFDFNSIKEIIGTPKKLKGSIINFIVPKEWGQKTVFLIATNKQYPDKKVRTKIYVKDHIVAAFYRVDTDNAKEIYVYDILDGGGTNNLIPIWPVYHFQGLYKDKHRFYLSTSTGNNVHSYAYIIDETEDSAEGWNLKHYGTKYFRNNKLKDYSHPGGLQSSNGLLMVGFEKYRTLDLGTMERSIIAFFETEGYNEINEIRIIKDEEYKGKELQFPQNKDKIKNELASASGIIYIDNKYIDEKQYVINKWIAALRGNAGAIDFYVIKKGFKKYEINQISNKYEAVGSFQNVHLFLNEKNDIYMIGMQSAKGKFDDGTQTNFCWLYRLDIQWEETDNDIQPKDIQIIPVWIDKENGELKEGDNYKEINKQELNKIKFTTQKPASFEWSSCVYLENKYSGKEGFTGEFKVYVTGSVVECDYAINETAAREAYDDYVTSYQEDQFHRENNGDAASHNGHRDTYEDQISYGIHNGDTSYGGRMLLYEEFKQKEEFRYPINPRIYFNIFSEKS
ncbi:hypothetical protein [Prevotella sp. 10(H)]|uniref:hypothetical protein n=1 Tax=Prevotella sp. 10(H) TaxID=1158294 RepID=UPI0004A713EF|nr:hypothetical protein [Prevotella sp. 10(H)]